MLCSEHFSDECFDVESKLAAEFWMKRTKRLKADAVPSIFTRSSATSGTLREPHCARVVASLQSPAQRREWFMRNVKNIVYV